MKILVENYTFNAATKEIALTDYTSVNLESFLLITNVTDNIIIYNFADPAKGGTVTGNVLTLDFNTTGMSNTDSLQVFIDDGESPATNAALETIDLLLTQLLKRSESLAVVDTAQRQRVAVEAMPTVNVNATVLDPSSQAVFALNNAATFARMYAVPDIWRTIEMARQTYQQAIRSNLTF